MWILPANAQNLQLPDSNHPAVTICGYHIHSVACCCQLVRKHSSKRLNGQAKEQPRDGWQKKQSILVAKRTPNHRFGRPTNCPANALPPGRSSASKGRPSTPRQRGPEVVCTCHTSPCGRGGKRGRKVGGGTGNFKYGLLFSVNPFCWPRIWLLDQQVRNTI